MIRANIDNKNNIFEVEVDTFSSKTDFLCELSFLIYKSLTKYSGNIITAKENFNYLIKGLKESNEEGFLDLFIAINRRVKH